MASSFAPFEPKPSDVRRIGYVKVFRGHTLRGWYAEQSGVKVEGLETRVDAVAALKRALDRATQTGVREIWH